MDLLGAVLSGSPLIWMEGGSGGERVRLEPESPRQIYKSLALASALDASFPQYCPCFPPAP